MFGHDDRMPSSINWISVPNSPAVQYSSTRANRMTRYTFTTALNVKCQSLSSLAGELCLITVRVTER